MHFTQAQIGLHVIADRVRQAAQAGRISDDSDADGFTLEGHEHLPLVFGTVKIRLVKTVSPVVITPSARQIEGLDAV